MANLIRVKQLDQPDLSGFFNDAFINTGILHATFVDKFTDENISGIKTFALGISAPNLVYNTGNQIISGVKTFATGIFDKASGNFILFNSATAPSSPAKGQLFFDTINNNFSGYNGTSWLKLNN